MVVGLVDIQRAVFIIYITLVELWLRGSCHVNLIQSEIMCSWIRIGLFGGYEQRQKLLITLCYLSG